MALEPVDLTVEDGSVVALIGPSGCGKTTLLRTMAGLTCPTGGTVDIDGREVWRAERPDPAALEGMAVVFQDPNLLPWLTVEANIALPLRLRGVPRPARLAQARELCDLMGIEGFGQKRPATLSGGMRQRAAIARALVASPRTILMDEPFASLDAITRESMNMELQRVWQHRPCTSVLVTHSIAEAVLLADRIITLTARPGRVAGVTEVPFARPRPPELQYTPEFQDLVREVRALLVEVS